MKKNRKNKKKGKVKIVAGIMTREQESDSTLSPEKEEGGVEIPSPRRFDGRRGYQHPLQWVSITTGDNTKGSDVFLLRG